MITDLPSSFLASVFTLTLNASSNLKPSSFPKEIGVKLNDRFSNSNTYPYYFMKSELILLVESNTWKSKCFLIPRESIRNFLNILPS